MHQYTSTTALVPVYQYQCTSIPVPVYQYQCTIPVYRISVPYQCTSNSVSVQVYRCQCTSNSVPVPVYQYQFTSTSVPVQVYRYQCGESDNTRCRYNLHTYLIGSLPSISLVDACVNAGQHTHLQHRPSPLSASCQMRTGQSAALFLPQNLNRDSELNNHLNEAHLRAPITVLQTLQTLLPL